MSGSRFEWPLHERIISAYRGDFKLACDAPLRVVKQKNVPNRIAAFAVEELPAHFPERAVQIGPATTWCLVDGEPRRSFRRRTDRAAN